MITKNLTKSLEELGFTYVEGSSPEKSHAYALYGGYLVTVYEVSGKKVAYFNFKFTDNEENNLKKYAMSEAFSASMEEFSVTDYSISEDGMRVFSSGAIPVFLKLIDSCIALLIENEIRGYEYCSKCGNKFGSRNPKKVTTGKENHLMCEHCALDKMEEIKNNVNEASSASSEKGKVLGGVIGSTVFAFIGAVLYFVLYYWLSPVISGSGISEVRYIFCATGFIVALLSYIGYRMFCKNISVAAYVSVSVTSLLFTAIGQYVGIVFEFIAKNGFSASVLSNKHFWLIHLRNTIPAEILEQFTDYSAIFYKLLAISLMFAAVGAAIFLLTLHDKSHAKKETVEIETITIKK